MLVAHDPFSLASPSLAEARQILFRSFLLSQGVSDLQEALLRYAVLRYAHWHLSPGECEELRMAVAAQCAAFLAGHFHPAGVQYSTEEVHREVSRQLSSLLRFQDTKEPSERGPLLADILRLVVIRDHYYLVSCAGRPRPTAHVTHAGSFTDPSFGHFPHFLLLHLSTGCQVFNQLFRELEAAYTQRLEPFLLWRESNPHAFFQVTGVLRVHNAHYPQRTVPLPDPF